MKLRNRIGIFGLVLCLILISGWTGWGLSSRQYDGGGFLFVNCIQGQSAGMKGVSDQDKTMILNVNDATASRSTGEEQLLCAQDSWVLSACCGELIKQSLYLLPDSDNDQLDLVVVAPRA